MTKLLAQLNIKRKILLLSGLSILGVAITPLLSKDNSSGYMATGIFLLLIVIITVILIRTTARPLQEVKDVLALVADGKYDVEIPYTENKDEIGEMARTVLVLRDNGKQQRWLDAEMEKLEEESEREEAEEREKQKVQEAERADKESRRLVEQQQRAEKIAELITDFDEIIQASIGELEASATQMQGTASAMVDVADNTGRQAAAVNEASDQMDGNVSTMASAIEEFSASIAEANLQVQSATKLSDGAVVASEEGQASIEKLSSASKTIEDVVSLINDIADQTNLLALNATIEAARAGEAGRGFAVVAGEVKSLASQTAGATENITKQIKEMQALSGGAVSSMGVIQNAISELNQTMLGISAAIEQQEAATSEISRNVQYTAEGTQRVASEIGQVAANVEMTKNSSGDVKAAASQLESLAACIKEEVQDFLKDVQAV